MKIKKVLKHGKERWMLDKGIVQGKRQRQFFDSKKKAEKELGKCLAIIEADGRNALALPVRVRVDYIDAENRLAKIGWTINRAVDFVETFGKQLIEKTPADAVADCVAVKEATGKRKIYTKKLKVRLLHFFKDNPVKLVSDVTQDQIEVWAHAGEKSLSTVRGRIIDIQTFFSFCIKRNWCIKNPAKDIDRIQLEDNPPGIHTIMEVETVLKCALEHDRSAVGYLAICYFAGLRPVEAQSLSAEQIHDDVIEITGRKSKTRRRRFIPINDTLKAWLAVSGSKIKASKRRLIKLRWILSGKPKSGDYRSFPWPHDVLRHSFCSYGLPKFGATKIAEWAGHSEQILFAHYRERVRPLDAEAYWNLRP